MSAAQAITQADFQEMLKTPGFILIDFWATWCPPCKFMSPIIDSFAEDEEMNKVSFVKVDADAEPDLTGSFGVTALPTFYLIKTAGDGTYEVVEKYVGAQDGLTFKTSILQAVEK